MVKFKDAAEPTVVKSSDTSNVFKKAQATVVNKKVNSFTAVYGMELKVKDEDHFNFGRNALFGRFDDDVTKKNEPKSKPKTNRKTIPNSNASKEKSNVSKKETVCKDGASGETKFIMTYGKLSISDDDRTVCFPFLESFEIEILRDSSITEGMLGIDRKTLGERTGAKRETTVGKDEEGHALSTTSKDPVVNPYNCVVNINFNIPASIQRIPRYLKAFLTLALAVKIRSDELKVEYMHDTDNALVIKNLESIDFDSGQFNPISSSGPEDLSFTRKFVGFAGPISEEKTLEEFKRKKKDLQLEIRKAQKLEEEINNDYKSSKSENLDSKEKYDARVKVINEKRAKLDAMKKEIELINGRPTSYTPLEYEKSSNYTNSPDGYSYTVTFQSLGVNFVDTFLAEDSAMENSGMIQVQSVFEDLRDVHQLDYETFDIKLISPAQKEKKVNSKTTDKKVKDDKGAVTSSGRAGKEITSGMNDYFRQGAFRGSNPKAFNLILRLPRAIMNLFIFDDIRIINSTFGVYDGLWRVMKVDLTYESNGQFTQELLLVPKGLAFHAKNKKTVKETSIDANSKEGSE